MPIRFRIQGPARTRESAWTAPFRWRIIFGYGRGCWFPFRCTTARCRLDLPKILGPFPYYWQRHPGAYAAAVRVRRPTLRVDERATGDRLDQHPGGGAGGRAAPVFHHHLHLSGPAVPAGTQGVCRAVAAAAGGGDLPGNFPLPGADHLLLFLGLVARAAPDPVPDRLLPRAGSPAGRPVFARRGLRVDPHGSLSHRPVQALAAAIPGWRRGASVSGLAARAALAGGGRSAIRHVSGGLDLEDHPGVAGGAYECPQDAAHRGNDGGVVLPAPGLEPGRPLPGLQHLALLPIPIPVVADQPPEIPARRGGQPVGGLAGRAPQHVAVLPLLPGSHRGDGGSHSGGALRDAAIGGPELLRRGSQHSADALLLRPLSVHPAGLLAMRRRSRLRGQLRKRPRRKAGDRRMPSSTDEYSFSRS